MDYNHINKIPTPDRGASNNDKERVALALADSALRKVPNFFHPEQYKNLLRLFARFHRYSHLNTVLIYLQHPSATYLAGFDTWRNSCLQIWNNPTRQVLKEESKGKGIRLLAPYTDISRKPHRRLTNYPVSVYDISQTNELPPLEQEEEYIAHAKGAQVLSALRHNLPYRIAVAGNENTIISNGIPGYCDHKNQLIIIYEGLRGKKLLTETVRQAATAELELLDYHNEKYIGLIIESVVYVLAEHFGECIDTGSNSFTFVQRHLNAPPEELNEVLFVVQRLSHTLIENIEGLLHEIAEYDTHTWLDEEALLDFDLLEVVHEV